MADQVRVLAEDNARLRQEAQGGIQAIPALVHAVTRLTAQPTARPGLVDTKGIGKPTVSDGTESKYREWAAKFESFVVEFPPSPPARRSLGGLPASCPPAASEKGGGGGREGRRGGRRL